ncbi:MAG TPA: SDR family oxidoreductase, partial [Pseudomonadales bacterium]|nr:SDR family oxidoreductase [Pseudomonadales bacterium]
MGQSLDGHNALVTGGGSGIGLASAKAFARDGAAVTLMGRKLDKLEAAAAQIRDLGGMVRVVAGDVGVEADVARAVAVALEAGPLTIAVANAGIGTLGPIIATDAAQWDAVLTTNLRGTFLTFKHAGAAIVRTGGGAMCAISSIAGVRTHRFMGTYCVTKAGIDMLVRNTADEMGVAKVRVNSVLPGLVDTEIAAGLFATDSVHADYLKCMPISRTGTVDDIAAAVRFLCGPEASWIT